MYATWLDYVLLTDMGTKKEVIGYQIPSWATYEGQFTWTSSPDSGHLPQAFMYYPDGLRTQWQGYRNSGARLEYFQSSIKYIFSRSNRK